MGFPRENLRIYTVAAGGDQFRHAAYPTAITALCGIPLDDLRCAGGRYGSARPPTCERCAETAEGWDRIDRSAPVTWYRRPLAEAA